jgi:hypothetical protein
MRFSLLVLGFNLIFWQCKSQNQIQTLTKIDFVSVEHIGVDNKPIKFIIAYQDISSDSLFYYNSILKVDKDIFELTYSCTQKLNTYIQKVSRNDFGVFRIILCKNGVREKYLIPSRQDAVEYFGKLKNELDKEVRADKLVREFENTINRLSN